MSRERSYIDYLCDMRIVWDTVQRALPDLILQIEQVLADLIQE